VKKAVKHEELAGYYQSRRRKFWLNMKKAVNKVEGSFVESNFQNSKKKKKSENIKAIIVETVKDICDSVLVNVNILCWLKLYRR
jgi:hypothetical protein